MTPSICQTQGLAKPTRIRALLCVIAFSGLALILPASQAASDAASAVLPVIAADDENTLPSGTVALVNGVAIARTELDNALRDSGQPDTPLFRQAMKQNLIAREIFRQNAEKAHYDIKPEVLAAIAEFKINAETRAFLKDNVHPEPVSDAQVKNRYDEIVASLGQEDYKPRVIVVSDDASARDILAQLKRGAAFDVLARQNSIDPTTVVGGEMAWISFKAPATQDHTQGLPLAVAQALTQLPVGGVAPDPLVVGNTRVIVKLDAKRPTQVPNFEQIKETVRKQLQMQALRQAMAAFVAAQTKAAKILQ